MGELAVRDLPEAWNQGMADRLEVTPANDVEGCLQDIHWAHGSFGYFPSYAIGASHRRAAVREPAHADAGPRRAAGARRFLRASPAGSPTHVHADGARLTLQELVKQATGKPLAAQRRRCAISKANTWRRPDERP